MDMALITGTISGLKTASDIAKSFLDIKKINDISGKVAELQAVILSAQSSAIEANSAQFAMIEEIRALKEEMARIKAWDSQKERYILTSPWAGAFIYSLKESLKESEPPHWICANCYEKGVRSILQERGNSKTGFREFFCSCGSVIHAHHRGKGYKIEYGK